MPRAAATEIVVQTGCVRHRQERNHVVNNDGVAANPEVSLPSSSRKGDLIVHDGTTNVAECLGGNGTFLHYDSASVIGLAAVYAPTVKKCAAPAVTTNSSRRVTTRLSATGTGNSKAWRFPLAGLPLGDEAISSVGSAAVWVNSRNDSLTLQHRCVEYIAPTN